MRMGVNVLWSFLGTVLPLAAAVAVIPTLIETLGTARFGVLSLAWIVVGYFSFFDFGLGRAMTQLIAKKIGKGEEAEIPELVWGGVSLISILGLIGALFVVVMSPWLVGSQLKIPDALRAETLTAFYLLAASIPIVVITTALRGVLEARQRFDIVNLVRAPLGTMMYLGPLLVLPYSHELPLLVLTLMIARIISCGVYLIVCLTLYPDLRKRQPLHSKLMRQLFSFGGWMTLSNVAAPLLLYLGRLLLAILVSAEAVAYFSTPYDIVINLLIIPGVFISVLFPMFTHLFQNDVVAVRALYRRWMLFNFLAMLPLALITYALAKPALAWWINEEFAANSYFVAQLLAVGIFINSFGHISQALIQSYGRPDVTAKLHLIELVAYVPYLWWLIERSGIDGAAIAWIVRVTISTLALWVMANRCLTGSMAKRY